MGTENQPPSPAESRPVTEMPPASMRTELERQRQTSQRLLSELGAAIGRSATHVRRTADFAARRTGEAAHYVQERYVRDWASGLGRLVRRHPAAAIVAVMLAGYVAGRALRRR